MVEAAIAESCPRVDCHDLADTELQPYPDISGNGVLIGFIGTAYLVLLLVVANFIVAYDPEKHPFHCGKAHDAEIDYGNWWQPNPIDLRLLRFIRRCKILSFNDQMAAKLRVAFDEAIISLCDIQLVTGLGILISCYILLQCALDAYHWQIAVYLAWFSTVTHLSGLTALRSYLNTYAWTKYVRYTLMLSLLILLLVGLVPTGYLTARSPHHYSPALCFFRRGYDYWNTGWASPNHPRVEMTGEWQAMVLSIVQLVVNFGNRSVKLFRPLSKTFRNGIRRPLSDRSKRLLLRLSRPIESSDSLQILKTKLVLEPAVAVFFTCRITADMFSSTFFEIFWLVVILLWGTVKLLGARNDITGETRRFVIEEAQSQWTFGQILPVLLLIGPIFTTAGIFGFHLTRKETPPGYSRPESSAISSETMLASECEMGLSRRSTVGMDVGCSTTNASTAETGFRTPEDQTEPTYNKPEIPYLDNYTDAPWLPACVAVPFIGLLSGTIMAFAMVFNFNWRFKMNYTLRDVWIDEWNFIFVVFVSYPCACATSIRIGLGLDEWIKKTPSLRFHAFWHICVCSVIYATNFVLPVFLLPRNKNLRVVTGLGGLYFTVIIYVCHAYTVCRYVGRK